MIPDLRQLGLGALLGLFIGLALAWWVQGLRWDNDIKSRDVTAQALQIKAVGEVNTQLVKSRAETESIRVTFIAFKQGNALELKTMESAVASGIVRLRLAATCTTADVRAAGTDARGTASASPELDAAARPTYFALRDGLNEQRGLLTFCQAELRKRSAK